MFDLFQDGPFDSHSLIRLPFKIECDVLTTNEISCLARFVAERTKPFRRAYPVPSHNSASAGLRLADELSFYYATPDADRVLLVDDVLTTGASMEEARRRLEQRLYDYGLPSHIDGIVIFSWGLQTYDWIRPIFTLNKDFHDYQG